jgi:ribosome-binding protein aMBF1 (putative translation factor)
MGSILGATLCYRALLSQIVARRPMPGHSDTVSPKLSAVIARNIAAERVRRGWKQQDLGDRIGWARSSVGALESGQRRITVDHLGPLCAVFGITLRELTVGADEEELRTLGLL